MGVKKVGKVILFLTTACSKVRHSSTSSDKPLPAGWEERVSGESGNVYYFNTYAPVGTPKSEFGWSGTG
jgi:hypothetical protein